MIDQITIRDKASFDDFGASVAKREWKQPRKKSIKDTVPFSNATYDFTKINGEIYWEERELEYILEMIAPTPERLVEMKAALSGWLMNIIEQELHDPVLPDYHFVVTYADMDFDDDEDLEKTTVTLKLTAYPYKISNYRKAQQLEIPASSTKNAWILNRSNHRITPKIIIDKAVTLTINGISHSMSVGTIEDEAIMLEEGMNEIVILNGNSSSCKVIISFYEEVF